MSVRKVLGFVVPAVLVLGAAGGGVAYTKHTVDTADRTVPTTVWSGSEKDDGGKDPVGDPTRGRASTPLSKLLLPVPEEYRLGPDIDEYGNDTEISGRQAAALFKESARGLAGKERRDFERRVDKLGIQGIALRSYTSEDDDHVVEVQIIRMKDRKQLHDLHKLRAGVAELLEIKKGPKIKGHKNAACYESPLYDWEGEESELAEITCGSYEGEFYVTVRAYGSKPLTASAVADLVKDQLDHLTSPGEYV